MFRTTLTSEKKIEIEQRIYFPENILKNVRLCLFLMKSSITWLVTVEKHYYNGGNVESSML